VCRAGGADECETAVEFAAQDLDDPRNPGLAAGRQSPKPRAPDHPRRRAQSKRLHEIAAAAYSAKKATENLDGFPA
jgi:hypothetical protein